MGREAGEWGCGMWGAPPTPGPLNSAPGCTGRPRGRGQGLDPEEASPHSTASLQTTESKPPHPHLQCPDGENEALRGEEVCPGLHGRACSGVRQSDWNDGVERQRLRDTDRNHPVMEAERETGTQRETDWTTWIFTLSLPLAAPSEDPK